MYYSLSLFSLRKSTDGRLSILKVVLAFINTWYLFRCIVKSMCLEVLKQPIIRWFLRGVTLEEEYILLFYFSTYTLLTACYIYFLFYMYHFLDHYNSRAKLRISPADERGYVPYILDLVEINDSRAILPSCINREGGGTKYSYRRIN